MSVESFIKRVAQRDVAVWWTNPTNAADGTVTYDGPSEIDCIWMEDDRRIKDFYEKEVASRAHVYVTFYPPQRSMLYHGKLSELTASEKADPKTIENAYEIRRVEKVAGLSLKNKYMYKVYI